MQCSFSLQFIFFSEQPFYGNYSTLDSHTNTNFSRACLLVKMASKTVIKPIYFKRFQSDFLIFSQNYPLNQYYRCQQFCHFSTAKIPSWYMAFIRKWYSTERAMPPLSICEIKLWGDSNCENIYGTRVIYDL